MNKNARVEKSKWHWHYIMTLALIDIRHKLTVSLINNKGDVLGPTVATISTGTIA